MMCCGGAAWSGRRVGGSWDYKFRGELETFPGGAGVKSRVVQFTRWKLGFVIIVMALLLKLFWRTRKFCSQKWRSHFVSWRVGGYRVRYLIPGPCCQYSIVKFVQYWNGSNNWTLLYASGWSSYKRKRNIMLWGREPEPPLLPIKARYCIRNLMRKGIYLTVYP